MERPKDPTFGDAFIEFVLASAVFGWLCALALVGFLTIQCLRLLGVTW